VTPHAESERVSVQHAFRTIAALASGRPKQTGAYRLGALQSRREVGLSILLLFFMLGAWEWVPPALGIPPFIVPSFSAVVQEFLRMQVQANLWTHFGITFAEVVVGFLLGSLLGMAMGFVFGLSRTAEFLLSPYILLLQIAPKVAFAPLFILWFGYTVYPKILVAVLIVFFPIMINVLKAMQTVDPAMINLARSFSATRNQVFWKIEFPSCMPPLFAGLRIGSTLAVIGIVVGEFVGGNEGLAYLLVLGEGQGRTSMVFVCIILLTVIGIIAYLAVIALERRLLHYLPERSVATG
jgi:NitT/TauT family transport system permease protein